MQKKTLQFLQSGNPQIEEKYFLMFAGLLNAFFFQTHYIFQAFNELVTLLSQLPMCWTTGVNNHKDHPLTLCIDTKHFPLRKSINLFFIWVSLSHIRVSSKSIIIKVHFSILLITDLHIIKFSMLCKETMQFQLIFQISTVSAST